MPVYAGKDLLLTISDGESPESYIPVSGLQSLFLRVENIPADASTVEDGLDKVLSIAHRQIRLIAEGMSTDSASMQRIMQQVFSAMAVNYRCMFPGGGYIAGAFYIDQFERSGKQETEERYILHLRGSGDIAYIPV